MQVVVLSSDKWKVNCPVFPCGLSIDPNQFVFQPGSHNSVWVASENLELSFSNWIFRLNLASNSCSQVILRLVGVPLSYSQLADRGMVPLSMSAPPPSGSPFVSSNNIPQEPGPSWVNATGRENPLASQWRSNVHQSDSEAVSDSRRDTSHVPLPPNNRFPAQDLAIGGAEQWEGSDGAQLSRQRVEQSDSRLVGVGCSVGADDQSREGVRSQSGSGWQSGGSSQAQSSASGQLTGDIVLIRFPSRAGGNMFKTGMHFFQWICISNLELLLKCDELK